MENVLPSNRKPTWGRVYNAAQFSFTPIQNRNRVIGGRYKEPKVYREYKYWFPGICPTITATEFRGCATDKRRASRFYGRKITIWEAAYHQGFTIPVEWNIIPDWFKPHYRSEKQRNAAWLIEIYQAIGNGVPVYMAEAFGRAHRQRKAVRVS